MRPNQFPVRVYIILLHSLSEFYHTRSCLTYLLFYRNQKILTKANSKNFFTFKSFSGSDFSLGSFTNKIDEDQDGPIDITKIKSSLIRFLLLMKNTIDFH